VQVHLFSAPSSEGACTDGVHNIYHIGGVRANKDAESIFCTIK
jgi:hypothetical protein